MKGSPGIYLGLDVGGTKVAGGLVAFPSARVIECRAIPTRSARGGAAVLEDTLGLAKELAANADRTVGPVTGIGVGVCELVDLSGRIVSANAIDWRAGAVVERLRPIAPVWVEADVRAAALAEAEFGAGVSFNQFLFVTVGTGISSCLVLNRRPFSGARGLAGTMASTPLPWPGDETPPCRTPTLEDLASGPAMVARYCRKGSQPLCSAPDVIRAASQGDDDARAVVRSAATALGAQLGLLISALDPAALVVGGGLGTSGGDYWGWLVAATRAHIYSELQRDLPILAAGLGPNAGWIGAAATAWVRSVKEGSA